MDDLSEEDGTVDWEGDPWPNVPEDRHVFVLTGLPGSGKSTAAEIISDELTHRFERASHHEVSDFCRYMYEYAHDGEVVGDNDLGRWTAELKAEHGNDYIVREFANWIHANESNHVALAGVRSPEEAEAVRDVFGAHNVTTIAIWTLPDIRFERKYGDPPSEDHEKYPEFEERNDRELHEWGCIEFFTGAADYIVPNNGELGELEGRLSAIISQEVEKRHNMGAIHMQDYPFPSYDPEVVAQYL